MSEEIDLSALRERARALVEADPSKLAMRSCWNCNTAHAHFKDGAWGEWVLLCFACGHYFFEGVDITEAEDPDDGGVEEEIPECPLCGLTREHVHYGL